MKRTTRCAAAVAGVLASSLLIGCGSDGGSASDSVELRFGSWVGETSAMGEAITWWMDEVESRSEGKVSFSRHWSGTLVGATEIAPAMDDGRLDIGHMSVAYYPGKFPLTSVAEIPLQTSNMPAVVAALQEEYGESPALREEWSTQGLHLLQVTGVTPSILGSREPVDELSDLRGMSVRTVALMTDAFKAIGGNPVAIDVNEIYESMDKGLLDGYFAMTLDIAPSLALHEVGPHIIDPKLGVYSSTALAIPERVWNDLPEDVVAVIEGVNEEYPGVVVDAYRRSDDAACERMKEENAQFNVLPESEIESWRDIIGNTLREKWMKSASEQGVDAGAFLESYLATLDAKEAELGVYETGIERCMTS